MVLAVIVRASDLGLVPPLKNLDGLNDLWCFESRNVASISVEDITSILCGLPALARKFCSYFILLDVPTFSAVFGL